jgi:protein TonB
MNHTTFLLAFIWLIFSSNNAFSQQSQNQSPEKVTASEEEELIFVAVEQSPEFIGGNDELYKYLGHNLRYPQEALMNNTEGLVLAQFIIGKDGKVKDSRILKSPSEPLSEEALRVVIAMPAWQAGKQNGKEVSVRMVLPITFKLPSLKKKK